ncbi:hypothetical protein GGR56DRAFT_552525 [Xylariaceae sp. FL0804]|nr:hypothetical protein GGR56DRAFT_552525 [Xylariaceae sp. FL0804]
MHPAPSLAESFPKSSKSEDRPQHVARPHDQPDGGHAGPMKLDSTSAVLEQSSPPGRKDTGSSASTNTSDATVVTTPSTETAATAFSVESSQSIFSIKDGSEISGARRASRRRTGPLSAQQREKAALIRKLGACGDCRRRRVACHPNHHNMSWEDAVRKYRSSSPLQDLAPLVGRPLSPVQQHARAGLARDPQEMDVDSSPPTPQAQTTPGRTPLRTPLPSGPRPDKPLSVPAMVTAPPPFTTSPRFESVKAELESAASRILSSPHRNRYTCVCALLITWQEDEEPSVADAVRELRTVFEKYYHFSTERIQVPPNASNGCTSSGRWLARIVNEFIDKSDTRDVLKVVYYSGYSYLDPNGEMVLASCQDRERASTIRWSGIQQILEEARADTLIVMDAAYYPSSRMLRQKGVLEIIAASASEEYFRTLRRGAFTRALSDQLRVRASQRVPAALSAAELHAKLLSSAYPGRDAAGAGAGAGQGGVLPPLHMQMAGNVRLPSITLSPPQPPRVLPPSPPETLPHSGGGGGDGGGGGGPQVTLSIRLADEPALSLESWLEWFRMMPEGVRDVRVDGPYQTLR